MLLIELLVGLLVCIVVCFVVEICDVVVFCFVCVVGCLGLCFAFELFGLGLLWVCSFVLLIDWI